MLTLIVLWSLSAASHAQGSQFKPQVVGAPPGTSMLDSLNPFARPPLLDATPKPVVGPQQPPLQPGQPDPKYGATSKPSEKWNELMNKLGNRGEFFNGGSGSNGEYFGPGIMEKCDKAPASAEAAYNEAKTYRASCGVAQRGEQQKIAVNDYSTRPAYMYIFDLAGKCLGKTMVAFGNGAGGAQVACSTANSHLSPAGFHLTATHHGNGKYNPGNSLKMVGLQGQGSVGRGILLHATRAPGTSSTWGCAGVGYDAFNAVKNTLGEGALIYNYWTPQQMAQGCRPPVAGMCQADAGTPGIPQNATGQGTPAVAWNVQLFREAHAVGFPGPRERIRRGTEIVILRELELSGTYEIAMVKEEAVGPNVATPDTVRRALGLTESLKDFKKRIARDTNTIYVLKRDLPLLWEEEVFQLQKKTKKGK